MILSSPDNQNFEVFQHKRLRMDQPDILKNFSKYQFMEIGVMNRCLITKMKKELQIIENV